ncbi:M23 family metallopeptidase [Chondrinema litorale]|uniref:M23 family metallopeptidase n=1 Tax=Chondrinema litorale TaxID=2994555 RepID=UPI002543D1BC|nr:M23 family metallopeptidase [Chondrinema litorale]UZR94428.1 M23 family metallopeptidase [Chondrinema litorale]
MAKIKYYYDTETCRYERVKTSPLEYVINALGLLFVCVIFGIFFAWAYLAIFPSPNELKLVKENEELLYHYNSMNKELKNVQNMMTALQKRDDDIYRTIFEAEPIPMEIRQAGTGGSQKFQDLLESRLEREGLIINSLNKIDVIKRQMYIQSKSFDEIVELARSKQEMLAHIPAIQPIANKELKRLASGYGMRFHPILKVRRLHAGCDFSAPLGTPIYATGDGKVVKVQKSNRGYGNQVEIDHGFGYISKYAHMSKFEVRVGQKVKRGQIIGLVGNTGLSVAPHCHYEVIYKNRKVNPVNYFFNDLTDEQYEEMVKISSQENQSLGY